MKNRVKEREERKNVKKSSLAQSKLTIQEIEIRVENNDMIIVEYISFQFYNSI